MNKESIFKVNNVPLLIYMLEDDPLRSKYHTIVEAYGGIIVSTIPTPENGILFLTSFEYKQYYPAYSSKLIDDSIVNGRLMPLPDYQWGNSEEADQNMNVYMKLRKSSKYTVEQDEFILEQIRLHPAERGSHKFFDSLAAAPELFGHSNNSIRSRFRKHLIERLIYCYKVDDKGHLILDDHGKKIKVPVDDLPDKKRKFTAADDYVLCLNVIKYAKETLGEHQLKAEANNKDPSKSLIPDSPSVPVSFFKDVMRKFPNHTDQSWRDRYRKFAMKYGIKQYIKYYEHCKESNQEPKPMKDFTSNAYLGDSRADLETKASSASIRENIGSSYDERANVPLDEEISQVKNSNIDEALKNQKVGAANQPQRPVLASLEDEDEDDEDDEDEDEDDESQETPRTKKKASKNATKESAPPSKTKKSKTVTTPKVAPSSAFSSPKKMVPSTPKSQQGKKRGNESPSRYDLQAAASVIATPPWKRQNTDKESSVDPEAKWLDKIKFIAPGTSFDELFEPGFYNLGPDELYEKLDRFYKELKGKSMPAIFKLFKEISWSPTLTGHLIKATNAHLPSLKRYNKRWLEMVSEDAGLLNDPVSLLSVEGVPGVWTEAYDSKLKEEHFFGTQQPSIAFQSEADKQKRLTFLKSLGEDV